MSMFRIFSFSFWFWMFFCILMCFVYLTDVMGKIVSLEPVQTVQVKGQDRKKFNFVWLMQSKFFIKQFRLAYTIFWFTCANSCAFLVVRNLHVVYGENMQSNWRFMLNMNHWSVWSGSPKSVFTKVFFMRFHIIVFFLCA